MARGGDGFALIGLNDFCQPVKRMFTPGGIFQGLMKALASNNPARPAYYAREAWTVAPANRAAWRLFLLPLIFPISPTAEAHHPFPFQVAAIFSPLRPMT